MVELKGSLGGIGLLSVVQLIGELHHSGTLQLDSGERHALLSFDDGRLIGAECGQQRDLQAVATCARELPDAEFTFVESSPPLQRTLDLGPSEVKAFLNRISNGEALEDDLPAISAANGTEIEVACQMLGFADDRDRHYSRPTALHRCYASGAASLVSAQEQRDLCLSGRFPTCPRYRNMSFVSDVAATADEPPRVVSRVVPALNKPPAPARTSGVSQLRVTPTTPAQPGLPPPDITEHRMNGIEPPPPQNLSRSRRGAVVAGASVLVGLVLLALALVMVLPRVSEKPGTSGQAAGPAAAPTAAVAAAVVVAPTGVIAAGARATAMPTSAPTATPAPRTVTPTAAARPTSAASGATLMDVRFAAGPADGWVDNQPFAGWSDGAYRMQARQVANFVAVAVPTDRVLGDVVVSGTFRKTGGPPGGGYGLIVRDQGPPPRDGVNQEANAYVLETGDLGEFGIWRRDGDHWVDLVPWTRTNLVRTGGSPNELSVRAIGDRLTFTVNGAELASVQDGTLLAGGVGVFVGGDYNEVALDRFSIQSPD